MDLLATTTVVQQYPISPSFISTFKFYNNIFFIFPTCNFNLESFLFYSYFSFSGPLFSLFFIVFVFLLFFCSFLTQSSSLCSFPPIVAPLCQFFSPYSLIATLIFLFLFQYSFSSSFFGLYWIQHKNWFYRLNPMHQEQSKRGLIIILSTLIYMI